MRLILTSIFLLVAAVTAQAEIYKSFDENGNVVFTDRPPSGTPSQEVKVTPSSVIQSLNTPAPTGQRPDEEEEEGTVYESLTVVEPANDAGVRSNDGNIAVLLELVPKLNAGNHRLELLMDGNVVADGSLGTFELENIDRGAHSVFAQVKDAQNNVLIRSPLVTFTVLRASINRAN